MASLLERLAQRLRDDPFFLASALAEHARGEDLDDAGLASVLGCRVESLTPLRLCRRPRAEPAHFRLDVARIAERFDVRPEALAAVVRQSDTLAALRRGRLGRRGLLMAARDRRSDRAAVDPRRAVGTPVPHWVSETTAEFWAAAGEQEPFPRDLQRPIAWTLPLALVFLPRLRLDGVKAWLQRRGIEHDLEARDRPLRACLVAHHGCGAVFLDGADSEAERRFSLAHELAHFLRGYWQPRRMAVERLGPAMLDVLDGDRPPRQEERVDAILRQVPLGAFVHLMDRTLDGHARGGIDPAEREADRLAFELLAPAAEVVHAVRGDSPARRQAALAERLRTTYGLPPAAATHYAALLMPPGDDGGSLVRRLGLVP